MPLNGVTCGSSSEAVPELTVAVTRGARYSASAIGSLSADFGDFRGRAGFSMRGVDLVEDGAETRLLLMNEDVRPMRDPRRTANATK